MFVVDVQPRSVRVTLDQVVSRDVPVRIDITGLPAGVQQGEMTIDPPAVSVRGASSVVQKVDVATAAEVGRAVRGSTSTVSWSRWRSMRRDRRSAAWSSSPRPSTSSSPCSRTSSRVACPCWVVITGTPGPGYRVAGFDPEPSIVSVQGDADDLVALQAVETEPSRLNGETATVTTTTELALPPNVTVPDVETVR